METVRSVKYSLLSIVRHSTSQYLCFERILIMTTGAPLIDHALLFPPASLPAILDCKCPWLSDSIPAAPQRPNPCSAQLHSRVLLQRRPSTGRQLTGCAAVVGAGERWDRWWHHDYWRETTPAVCADMTFASCRSVVG